MDQQLEIGSGDHLNLEIACKTLRSEKRFSSTIKIADLKNRLELITGVTASEMDISLFSNETLVAPLTDPEAVLNSYLSAGQLGSHLRLDVKDLSGKSEEFLDTNLVEKFELTEDEYSQRQDSVRAFKAQNKLGRFNEEAEKKKERESEEKERQETEKGALIGVNKRCEIRVPGQPTRRGTVMFIGETKFKPGVWVGIKFDEPLGKNDGSVGGKAYFVCSPKYGGFVRPSNVTVGDFPEEDDFLEEL